MQISDEFAARIAQRINEKMREKERIKSDALYAMQKELERIAGENIASVNKLMDSTRSMFETAMRETVAAFQDAIATANARHETDMSRIMDAMKTLGRPPESTPKRLDVVRDSDGNIQTIVAKVA